MNVRKRRWITSYRCEKYETMILSRLSFCKETVVQNKCLECVYRGNKDNPKEKLMTKQKVVLVFNQHEGVTYAEKKFVRTAEKGTKRLWMRGNVIGLTDAAIKFDGFEELSEEVAKQKHLGKTRLIGTVKTQEELDKIILNYFK